MTFFSLVLRVVPFLKKYAVPLLALGAMVFTYIAGFNHATDRCDAAEAERIQRAYEQGFQIARENAAFDREVITKVKEVTRHVEVPTNPDCTLSDDGVRRINEFIEGSP